MADQSFAAIGLPAALAIIMAGIGLTLTPQGFKNSLNSTTTIAWGVIGQLIVVPIAALVIAFALNLSPIYAVGLMLIAAAPGGVTTNLFTHLGRGNVPLSIVLTVLASIAMMVTMPFWVSVTSRLFAHDGATDTGLITVPPGPVIGLLIGVVAIPICIGMFIRARSAALAQRLEKVVGIVGVITIIVMFAFLVIDLKDQLGEIIVATGPSVVIFTAVVMAIGWGMAAAIKRPIADRIAFAVEFSLRNSTMSLVIALTVIKDTEVAAPAALFSVVMYIFGLAFIAWSRRAVPAPVVSSPAVHTPQYAQPQLQP